MARKDDRPPAAADAGKPAWHAEPAGAVAARLGTDPGAGLGAAEAARRLGLYGPNRLPEERGPGLLRRLGRQFANPLVGFLLVAAVLSLLFEHPVDAAVILAVVLLNAGIGFVQEGRAERALAAIRQMMDPEAVVVRDGRRMTIPAAEVVPGDLVLLEAGDRVPADLRLLSARALVIDESMLTGESVAVEKTGAAAPAEAMVGDRPGIAHAGTLVTGGQGAGVAVATGADTELGRISGMLAGITERRTPLIAQLDGFARKLSLFILALGAGAFLFAVLARGQTLDAAFMLVVALGVSAIPEGLPAVVTITLAIGVERMARRRALIRRLPAVETLGCVSVICSDKTGTLTRNEMTATVLQTADGEAAVSGAGLEPAGAISLRSEAVDAAIRTGLLASDAEVTPGPEGWTASGDPMEAALVVLALKAGMDPAAERAQRPRLDVIPFDPARRYMAVLAAGADAARTIHLKGAPETVLGMCDRLLSEAGEEPLDRAAWEARAEALAARGLRVLALAAKPAGDAEALDPAALTGGFLFLGLAGFIDPPRPEAVEAVAECGRAGITVTMITGDHAVTARAVAQALGLAGDGRVLTGADLAAMDDAALARAVEETRVFARTSPADKLRLLEAFQARGQFTAMTGDGVNDAPALKRADIGIAMGRKGTEAAKQAADMVLADDNFASIVAAVREGRTVYDNITKVIAWTLPTNGGEAFVLLAALAAGVALPVTPLQILWINMVTAVALGLTLAFEPTEPGAMRRPPRPPDQPLLTGELVWRILFVSGLFVLGAFGIFLAAKAEGRSLEEARTLVVNTIVVMEIFYLFSVRYVHGTVLTLKGVLGTPAVLAGLVVTVLAQLLLTYWPPLQALFETRPVALGDGLRVILVGVLLLLVVEAEKALRARWPAFRAARRGAIGA